MEVESIGSTVKYAVDSQHTLLGPANPLRYIDLAVFERGNR